jgi:hypothetical protein
MSNAAAVPVETADAAIARMEARLRILEEVQEIGLEILCAMRDEAVANPRIALEAAKAYAALSRGVRLSVMLAIRTEETLQALRAGLFGPPSAAPAPAARQADRADADGGRPGRETDRESHRDSADREAEEAGEALEDAKALDALEARLASYEAQEAAIEEAGAASAAPAVPPQSRIVTRLCADLKLVKPARSRSSLAYAPSLAPLLTPAPSPIPTHADLGPRPLRRLRE